MRDRARTIGAAAVAGALAALVVSTLVQPRNAQSTVPTFDGAQVAELIDSVTNALKQIQSLRQLGQSFVDFKDSVGSISDVAEFKSVLSDTESWRSVRSPKWLSDEATVANDPDAVGPRGPADEGEEEPYAVRRGGPIEEWDREEAVDRPKLENARMATEWTLDELYGRAPKDAVAKEISETRRIIRMRGRMLQGAARTAYAVGSAAPAAIAEYEEEREMLMEKLDEATSLREEVSVAAMASIAGLAARSEQVLINGIALELEALDKLMQTPKIMNEKTREIILGESPDEGEENDT